MSELSSDLLALATDLGRDPAGAALTGWLLAAVREGRVGVGRERVRLDDALVADVRAFLQSESLPQVSENLVSACIRRSRQAQNASGDSHVPPLWALRSGGTEASGQALNATTWAELRRHADALHWLPPMATMFQSDSAWAAFEDRLVESLLEGSTEEATDLAMSLALRWQSQREAKAAGNDEPADESEAGFPTLSTTLEELLANGASLDVSCPTLHLPGLAEQAPILAKANRVRWIASPPIPSWSAEHIAQTLLDPEAIGQALRSMRHPTPTGRRALVGLASDAVRHSLERAPQNDSVQQGLKALHEAVSDRTFDLRLAHIDAARNPLYIAQSESQTTAVLGAGNLTFERLGVDVPSGSTMSTVPDVTRWKAWYENEWSRATPFAARFGAELESSWAVATPTPYELYLKALFELSDSGDDLTESRAATPWDAEIFHRLADFQRVAVEQLVRMVDRYGGAFLADVVGLGKSYMGAAILRYYVERDRARPLILCPAGLTGMWERYSEVYGLNALVLSTGLLRRGPEDEPSVLLDPYRVRDRNFLLIDESHHFRNSGTQRYGIVREFLEDSDKRCLFLTATPQSRGPRDIYNQLRLFHQDDATRIPISPGSLSEFLRAVENDKADLRDLLQHILVRRTRTHVQRWYGFDAATGERISPSALESAIEEGKRIAVMVGGSLQCFPRRELRTLRYSIEEAYAGFYDEIRAHLGRQGGPADPAADRPLTYARYGLARYVRADLRTDPRYDKLRLAAAPLSGILRILLFKRLESSVHAFRLTVERMLRAHRRVLEVLESGWIPVGKEASELLSRNADPDDGGVEEQWILGALGQLPDRFPAIDFEVERLRADLAHDAKVLERIHTRVAPLTPEADPKLRTLLDLVASGELASEKIIIFTEYIDTAEYLHRALAATHRGPELDLAHTGSVDKRRVVGRFSPRANPEFRYRAGEDETNLLVATDVLSEGLNLQDCARVVNYDLHWNPVRLIQRFGRVDRIGTEHEVVRAYNFLPEIGLERHLGLEQVLASRIRDIHSTVGEDSAILHEDEELNPEAMRAIYEGNAADLLKLEQEDAPGFGILEAQAIMEALRIDDPSTYARIAALPDGIRSARRGTTEGVFAICRSGDYRRVYLTDGVGVVRSTDIGEALAVIACDAEQATETPPRSYNGRLARVLEHFRKESEERIATIRAARRRSDAQSWVVARLAEVAETGSTPLLRRRAEDLRELFDAPLTRATRGDLAALRRRKPDAAALVDQLESLYRRRRAAMFTIDIDVEEATSVPRFVCSEAIVSS